MTLLKKSFVSLLHHVAIGFVALVSLIIGGGVAIALRISGISLDTPMPDLPEE